MKACVIINFYIVHNNTYIRVILCTCNDYLIRFSYV